VTAEVTREGHEFIARVTLDSGAVWSFSDGGDARSLESFLLKAQEWLTKNGLEVPLELRQ
jgi:hypothetical protein